MEEEKQALKDDLSKIVIKTTHCMEVLGEVADENKELLSEAAQGFALITMTCMMAAFTTRVAEYMGVSPEQLARMGTENK